MMIDVAPVGGVFDLDDCLWDNQLDAPLGQGLHDKSRLAAIHEVGAEHEPALLEVTSAESYEAFVRAPEHTIDAAVWEVLRSRGFVDGDQDDNSWLLQAIMAAKNRLHHSLIHDEGREVDRAAAFVRAFAGQATVEGRVAVASGGTLPDVQLCLGKMGLQGLILPSRTVTQEAVEHPKPHPEMFQRGFAALGLPDEARAQTWGFEDDLRRGLRSAQAAGLRTAAITTRFSRDEFLALDQPPDLVADSWEEMADHFGLSLPAPDVTAP